MGQFRKRMYEEHAHKFSTDEEYNSAYKKVKRIKGFYSHLRIYLIINVLIITEGISNWHTYSTAIFWGIGLLAHGLSVFGRDLFFGTDWEEKKIQEFMNKNDNQNKWK
jgi:hypothetical protein